MSRDSLDEDWIDFLDWLGRSNKATYAIPFTVTSVQQKQLAAVARAYADHPERTGLLPILARLIADRSPGALPKFESLPTN